MEKNVAKMIKKPESQRTKNAQMNRKLAVLAMLTAMAVTLRLLETIVPLMPEFLKLDLSEIPVLIGAFAYGPVGAVMIELVKNLIVWPSSHTSGVGEIANFIAGAFFAGSAGLVYQFIKTRKGAVISMIVGTLVMTVGTSFFNYYVLLNLYGAIAGFPMPAIIGMAAEVNPMVTDKETLILWAFIPFNLFKGTLVSVLTFLIYKPVSKLIHEFTEVSRNGNGTEKCECPTDPGITQS